MTRKEFLIRYIHIRAGTVIESFNPTAAVERANEAYDIILEICKDKIDKSDFNIKDEIEKQGI